jgi:hypothetical protein
MSSSPPSSTPAPPLPAGRLGVLMMPNDVRSSSASRAVAGAMQVRGAGGQRSRLPRHGRSLLFFVVAGAQSSSSSPASPPLLHRGRRPIFFLVAGIPSSSSSWPAPDLLPHDRRRIFFLTAGTPLLPPDAAPSSSSSSLQRTHPPLPHG